MTADKRRLGKRIVIDASTARRSGLCQETLGIVKMRHCVAFSETGLQEWQRQEDEQERSSPSRRSPAKTWRLEMKSSGRYKVWQDAAIRDDQLRRNLRAAAETDSAWTAMEKDAHLIEAAQKADSIVISCDDFARRHFQTASSSVESLRPIHWGNPESNRVELCYWLKKGAGSARRLKLGAITR